MLVIIGMSAELSAEVVNVYVNGDESKNPIKDATDLSILIKQYTGQNIKIDVSKNQTDSTYLGLMSILQNTTDLGADLRKAYPKDKMVDRPEMYEKVATVTSSLAEWFGTQDIINKAFLKGTRLLALVDRKNGFGFKTFKQIFNDPDGHYDLIRSQGKWKNSGLGLTQKEYDQLKTVLKKFNKLEDLFDTIDALRILIGFVSGYERPSNNEDYWRFEETLRNTMHSTIDGEVTRINIIAHGDGAALVNKVLSETNPPEETTRMMSTATVDNYVWGGGKNFTLLEDIFIQGLRYFGSNALESNPGFTNHTDWYDGIGGFSFANWIKYGEINGHDFSKVYLAGNDKTTGKIVRQFVKNYNELKALDKPKKRENLWLEPIELEGYGSNVPQMKSIKFDSRVHYDSNEKPDSLKVKICYALSKTPYWRESDFVRGPRYSSKTFTTKRSSQKISNVSFYIPKTISLGDYYIVEKVDCDNQVQETDEEENQVQYQKIKVIAQEKEDIRTTDIKISGTGTGKIVIKNTMVYDGSDPDIGWVYQAYFFSSQPDFSTAKQFFVTKAQMGWGKNDRKTKQLTVDISKLPVGIFYIWVIVKKLDNSHDDDTSNNYFRVEFTTRPKSN